MSGTTLPIAPEPTSETAEFWDAANEGRLLLKRCLGSGRAFHPPRRISPFTGRPETEWFEASGAGKIYAFSITQRCGAPHCIAYVKLAEGPIILSALTECDVSSVQIGEPVKVTFVPSASGQLLPMFTLISNEGQSGRGGAGLGHQGPATARFLDKRQTEGK
ncbi:OB-fold domain-containing protein [Pseudooceanicola sp. CBS1P-1]|uniref:DNA-binding protein n=1 Tax=Pseudooceanicola albus TaxID=2692189 RepID=A0A6L7GD82_9RHOB|nr:MULTISPECIES: OB-fold domain-containing protein [Pseudooceanicola]MBT9386617.1 OB-fold domain-containing protein [Pseudooceanicola endophyticus]MXN20733.1 hypothetical protein [Pseudooceanicola albus]